jgi:O-antigen ligase
MRTVAFWLSLILIFMIPWENGVTIAGLGTLVRVTGLFVAAFWVVTVLVTGKFRRPHPFHLAVYLFVLWNIVSAFWSLGGEETVQRIKTYFQLFGMAWLLWDLYTTSATLRAGAQAYILGAYVSIGSTLFNYFAGKEAYAFSGGRYTGSKLNAGDLALILALSLPVAWHLAVSAGDSKRSYVLKLVNYAYIPASLFAILLTASRIALFAIVPALLFIIGTFTRLKLSSRILAFAALIGALLVLQPHIPQSSIDRLATAGTSIAAGDLGGRMALWRAGITTFCQHPLLGVGSGAFRTVIELGGVTHNTFLSVLAELGIIGFVLFVVILAIVVYQAVHQPKRYSRLWLAVLSVWAIGVSAQTWEFKKPTWLFLSLVVISANLSSQTVSQGGTGEVTDTIHSTKDARPAHVGGSNKLQVRYPVYRGRHRPSTWPRS